MKPTLLNPYLSFAGNCREALTFYQSCLGGELNLQAFADSPMGEQLPEEARQGIMHGCLSTGALTLMASDAGCMQEKLSPGNAVSLCLNCGSDEEIRAVFHKLSEGGTVVDPLADMFWGATFGTLTDKYGMSWLLNYDKSAAN